MRKKGLFGPESFGTFALKIVLIVAIKQALLKSPTFGCLSTFHSLLAGGLPSAFPGGWSSGFDTS